MNSIAALSYYKVERNISGLEQTIHKQDRWIYLYQEKVVTAHREFPIQEVFDISYRSMGGDGGMLYLHTLQGVYSYTITEDPQSFLKAYKALVHEEANTI
ncbi:hypothetical protein [Paenibacillus terrigena]|uniref:hypothetical protein n=1 Tax=Paenibacillus terrigena TaxID=369333 RepID=UPI00036CD9DD|nr:hypothetical protein [Paenibacillus terrigena]